MKIWHVIILGSAVFAGVTCSKPIACDRGDTVLRLSCIKESQRDARADDVFEAVYRKEISMDGFRPGDRGILSVVRGVGDRHQLYGVQPDCERDGICEYVFTAE